MTSTFSPHHFEVFSPESARPNFADAWGLTCAQLGATVSELLKHQPQATFRKEDLVGYHHLQYGMDPDIIEEVLEVATKEGDLWRNWDLAKPFFDNIPRILSDETTPALMERIVVGHPDSKSASAISTIPIDDLLTLAEDRDDHGRNSLMLYPADGLNLMYKGRVTHNIGRTVVGTLVDNLKVHTDTLELSAGESRRGALMVVTQEGHKEYGSVVQAMKIL